MTKQMYLETLDSLEAVREALADLEIHVQEVPAEPGRPRTLVADVPNCRDPLVAVSQRLDYEGIIAFVYF